MIRLYLNNIPITSTKNNVRIVCEFKSSEEYIKFENGIYLEKGEFAIKNIESIMINPEIITGVRLPYGNEFDTEKKIKTTNIGSLYFLFHYSCWDNHIRFIFNSIDLLR